MKQMIFLSSIGLGVVTTILMAITDIHIGLTQPTPYFILYFIFVGITTQVSMSLLMLINSFPTIQTYVKDYHSNHLLFLQHRLGNWRYFIQLHISNCLTSFIVGIGICVIYILLLSFKFPFLTDDPQQIVTSIAGGHWLLEALPVWTYVYFIFIIGLNFAFYQLLATFLTVLFPHETMCYLYSMMIWLVLDSLSIFENLPFYLSPRIVFALDNSFYESTKWFGIGLPMWYPIAYFLVIFIICTSLSVLWIHLKFRCH
ncbi:hypothetical protein JDW15_07045 [Aerococcaceae bacterium zg-ZJ1578]|nr:hypothetical protein [Aerococcaceae bacterium zg-1578]